MATVEGYQYKDLGKSISHGSLTFNTAGDEYTTAGCKTCSMVAIVTGIDTGASVTVQLQGLVHDTWVVLESKIIDSNGNFLLYTDELRAVKKMRPMWTSRFSGTPAVSCELKFG